MILLRRIIQNPVGRIFIINTPWVFPKLYKIAKPWIDPVTRSKFEINSKLPKQEFDRVLDLDLLPVEYGGRNEKAVVPHPCKLSFLSMRANNYDLRVCKERYR